MSTVDKILKYLKRKRGASGKEVAEILGISRQAVNKHLKMLIKKGKVSKEGRTKGAIYKIAGKVKPLQRFRNSYLLKNLEEDKVFKEIELLLNLRKGLRKNVFDLIYYAFTEILNNAIEHSQSRYCKVDFVLDQYDCEFRIRDTGIGIFYSIYKKFKLANEISGIQELIKGKTTTMREKHSGEGVFFTSKSGDKVSLRSHKMQLVFDNILKDVFIEEKKFIKGTEVKFRISRTSKRNQDKLFKFYAPEEYDYEFQKTKVLVRLFQREYMSRSEAKRLILGLDKFKEIVLDFKGVKKIGQGFADEIFRVFKKNHPDIEIKSENASAIVATMIKHVVDNKI